MDQFVSWLAGLGAFGAALPTAFVALVALFLQFFVGRSQAASSRKSAEAAATAAKASQSSAEAALKNAELKQSELERDAVKFLSSQRRTEVAELRSALIELHHLTSEKETWSDEEKDGLRRAMGEVRMRIMPNSPYHEDLLVAVSAVYACALNDNPQGVKEAGLAFVMSSQKKLNSEFRIIEEQLRTGKIE